jgi:hypothetical protein
VDSWVLSPNSEAEVKSGHHAEAQKVGNVKYLLSRIWIYSRFRVNFWFQLKIIFPFFDDALGECVVVLIG